MSDDNVEIVLRVYEMLNRAIDLRRAEQDWEAMAEWNELLQPNVVLEDAAEIPGATSYVGLDEIKRWLRDATDLFPIARWEPRELLTREPFVVIAAHGDFRGSGSGVPVEIDMTHIFTLRSGRVARVRAFFDREEALEAAGLLE